MGRNDRGVKQAGFLVLWKTTMPSILIETGFVSNLNEEAFLMSKKGQDYLASAIYRAIKEYKLKIEGKDAAKNNVNSNKNQTHEKTTEVEKDNSKQKETKPDKNIKSNKQSIYFSVQFASSSKKKSNNSPDFKGLKDVDNYYHNGLYKYIVGKENSLEEAVKLQKKLREKGFKDAFVVAFNNGKRISPKEAVKLLK